MKILFATSEIFPYSKTGGLGDVANFLPKSLGENNVNVSIITPYYKNLTNRHEDMTYVGSKKIYAGIYETIVHYFSLIENGLHIIFVQNQDLFERDNIYGYHDDDLRYIVFSYAVLEYVDLMNMIPQIIHVNDWQSATVPFLLDHHYRYKEKYKYIHTLLSIHNLQYQGNFGKETAKYFNMEFNYTYIHFDDVNYLKTGIMTASKINTVSPNYRNETLTHEFGFSLDGSLNQRSNDYVGILNGIDLEVFNSETDELIVKNYNTRNLKLGKKANKKEILKYFNMESDVNNPICSFVARLAVQKGINLLKQSLEDLINETNVNFIILGSGDSDYENYFDYLSNKYPNRVGFYKGYNESLAHQIYAGSDMFLMPSEFEPCGLGQMIAMRYATVPIVRETGGLKDTVESYNKFKNTGTGFSFYEQSPFVLKNVVKDAINLYNNEPNKWSKLIRRAYANDFGLKRMAKSYIKLYKEIIGGE